MIIKCRDCGGEMSNTATACPKCGRPHVHPGAAVFTVLLVLAGLYWAWTWIMG